MTRAISTRALIARAPFPLSGTHPTIAPALDADGLVIGAPDSGSP